MAHGAPDSSADLDLRAAWRRGDAELERDAVEFWAQLGILPAGVTPEERASELVAAAYRDGRLVGVTTASLNRYEPLRARFAFQRCAVVPELRRSQVGSALTRFSFALIEQWSAAHPEEKVLGYAGIIESPDLAEYQRLPVWGDGFSLVGYLADGRQVRVALVRARPARLKSNQAGASGPNSGSNEIRLWMSGELTPSAIGQMVVRDHRDVEQFLDRAVEADPFDEVAGPQVDDADAAPGLAVALGRARPAARGRKRRRRAAARRSTTA